MAEVSVLARVSHRGHAEAVGRAVRLRRWAAAAARRLCCLRHASIR
jgi:hypothetical protein